MRKLSNLQTLRILKIVSVMSSITTLCTLIATIILLVAANENSRLLIYGFSGAIITFLLICTTIGLFILRDKYRHLIIDINKARATYQYTIDKLKQ